MYTSVRASKPLAHVHLLPKGFTLLELIITIILIGVLSVVAAARFQNSSGFDTFSLQNQLIASLRHMQFRAMQDTRADYCHRIVFDTVAPAIGPPSNNYSTEPSAALSTCATTVNVNTPDYLQIDTEFFTDLGASFVAMDGITAIGFIDFDSFGRPLTAVNNCAVDCQITFSTQSLSNVCVNSEGFIRAC
ncbi:prepilin-type N-terminal cleavage/methylation domain-containing protein [Alteromonas sp. 5E99-2]|uniref:prepilin-type N-terminal cleavage/methylation domain-containing protein n=1 Tax=Alteromonas sp. 5E99-2 TaxID=2817683 RepID=UPI001A98136A|nr:prepilin-type N-terminal cleavage/methylation domain-containing protein [Alteromonas sp. 5E99-2]MBO1255841.1 prepilin-type N-terminal cleavage/methylation domain-containing protein [Alteromonas sp. 5E99-2]